MRVFLPDPILPVVIIRCKREVAEEAALYGFHIGYWRNPATGIDYLLDQIANESDAGSRGQLLKKWYEIVSAESRECGKLPTIWHDAFDLESVKCLGVPVYELQGESVQDLLSGLPSVWAEFLRREVKPVKIFYHVACMGNWKEIVFEQLGLIYQTGLPFALGVVGPESERRIIRRLGLPIEFESDDLSLYEIPTLALAWEWARENPQGGVIYVHTKGVSAPQSEGKRAWRRIMEIYVLERWKHRIIDLGFFDAVGVSWCPGGMPHFRGNFFATRCDWLASLQDPREYQAWNGPTIWGNPWKRMAAEMWIGSRPGIVAKSLIGTHVPLYEDHVALQTLNEIEKGQMAYPL